MEATLPYMERSHWIIIISNPLKQVQRKYINLCMTNFGIYLYDLNFYRCSLTKVTGAEM